MSLLCNCPAGAALADIPISECPESFGQVQKVIFQRIFSTGSTKNSFVAATADPKLKASWTPLLAAADGTKVVQSPYIQAPTTEAGAAKTYGGGNETLGGIEIIIGREPTSFTGNILRSTQDTIAALKTFMCETVGVYLVDEFGRIGALVDNRTTPTEYSPIPIQGLFVGDKSLGGLEAPDMNVVSWKFFPNWSDNLVILTPTDFNALTDLATPA
jgi:hypothetical protein